MKYITYFLLTIAILIFNFEAYQKGEISDLEGNSASVNPQIDFTKLIIQQEIHGSIISTEILSRSGGSDDGRTLIQFYTNYLFGVHGHGY